MSATEVPGEEQAEVELREAEEVQWNNGKSAAEEGRQLRTCGIETGNEREKWEQGTCGMHHKELRNLPQ